MAKAQYSATRRALLLGGGAAAAAAALGTASVALGDAGPRVRPPGALLDEDDFLGACIRCGRCGQACENDCIDFLGIDAGLSQVGSPFVEPRKQNCTLCMKCTWACPTGALMPIEATPEGVRSVKMGVARVDANICLSFNGYTCGTCVRACPLEGVALKAGMLERPEVIADHCTGCGACEKACIQTPQAIRIVPVHERTQDRLSSMLRARLAVSGPIA